jgi:hypothetical protein
VNREMELFRSLKVGGDKLIGDARALGAYFGCCCSVFGVAASWARLAIHASYAGEPRRGGASAGSPPIQGGMSAICSPTVRFTVLHDESESAARQRKANLVELRSRFMPDLCTRIVASPGLRGPSQLPALRIRFPD